MTSAEVWGKLRAPFPENQIDKLPRKQKKDDGSYVTIHLDYVGHAHVTDRLLQADPLWTWEPFAIDERGLPAMERNEKGQPVGLWIRLTVGGVTRLGFGSVQGGAFDAEKQLIGDAIRNAAMRFGVALDLWSKDEANTPQGVQQTRQRAQSGGDKQWSTAPLGSHGCPQCNENLVVVTNAGDGTRFIGHKNRQSSCKWKPSDEQRKAWLAELKDDADEPADLALAQKVADVLERRPDKGMILGKYHVTVSGGLTASLARLPNDRLVQIAHEVGAFTPDIPSTVEPEASPATPSQHDAPAPSSVQQGSLV